MSAKDWCPLFDPVTPGWPDRARAVIAEARRMLGAKPGTRPNRYDPDRLRQARALFAAAPAWLAWVGQARAAAEANADALPGLAFATETAWTPPPPRHDDRAAGCIMAICLARQGCLAHDARALREAERCLSDAQTISFAAAREGARTGGRKTCPDRDDAHAPVLREAERLRQAGKPTRGLAGRIARSLKGAYTERHIRNILRARRPD